MPKHYVGMAPLTLARTSAGPAIYVYAGQPAPEGIRADELERLVDEGFLVEVDVIPDVVPIPDDPGTGSPGTEPTTVRPKEVANKATWLDYRVAMGHLTAEQRTSVDAEQLELTVAQLKDDAFMDDWATSPAAPVGPAAP